MNLKNYFHIYKPEFLIKNFNSCNKANLNWAVKNWKSNCVRARLIEPIMVIINLIE